MLMWETTGAQEQEVTSHVSTHPLVQALSSPVDGILHYNRHLSDTRFLRHYDHPILDIRLFLVFPTMECR